MLMVWWCPWSICKLKLDGWDHPLCDSFLGPAPLCSGYCHINGMNCLKSPPLNRMEYWGYVWPDVNNWTVSCSRKLSHKTTYLSLFWYVRLQGIEITKQLLQSLLWHVVWVPRFPVYVETWVGTHFFFSFCSNVNIIKLHKFQSV